MADISSDTFKVYTANSFNLSYISAILVSIAHLSVGFGIIGLSTFIPGQLALLNWPDTIIALLLGIATLFELSRIFIGYFQDRFPFFNSFRRNYVLIGLIIQTLGLLIISQLLGSIFIIIGMIFFTTGSATVSTTIDAYLVDRSSIVNRNRFAATLQFFRLSGFAVGGILGSVLYATIGFETFFILLAFLGFSIGFISVLAITEPSEYKAVRKNQLSTKNIKDDLLILQQQIRKPMVFGMILFLLIYPLGLFLQDAILEPYAVNVFAFAEEGIGRLAAVWGISTLIFVPLGIIFAKKLGKMQTIILGTIIASIGILFVGLSGLDFLDLKSINLTLYQNSLLFFLVIFGVGLGLMTTPSTALMLDVTAISKNKTLLLSVFGLALTIGRSSASFVAAIIMLLENYQILFFVESLFLLGSIIPIFVVYRHLQSTEGITSVDRLEIFINTEIS